MGNNNGTPGKSARSPRTKGTPMKTKTKSRQKKLFSRDPSGDQCELSVINMLPRKILTQILGYLSISDLMACSLVSKKFTRAIDYVFKKIAEEKVSDPLLCFQMYLERSEWRSTSRWRLLYGSYKFRNEKERVRESTLVALYDYSNRDGSFSCKKGDTLLLIEKQGPSAFWLVTNESQTGWIPSGYVDFKQEKRSAIAEPFAMALFPYVAASSRELSLDKEDIVTVKKKANDGWWKVHMVRGGKRVTGWVPAAMVTEDVVLMKVLVDYVATGPQELTLRKGQIVIVLRNNNKGYYFAQLEGNRGWIPENFVIEVVF